ncbi:hypothetical protein EYF80_064697 [Liparis tanakae]|uniref:Uncharacterized protein n=1 Tax=Liparis tanakae TaxID=230148 RepID=A0A4Z2E8D3_9TELE|nr:hypothetical protein EYF80_064697 [Liparis tanakae]
MSCSLNAPPSSQQLSPSSHTHNKVSTIYRAVASSHQTGRRRVIRGRHLHQQNQSSAERELNRTRAQQNQSSAEPELNRTRAQQNQSSAEPELGRTRAQQNESSTERELNRTRAQQIESSTERELNRTRAQQNQSSAERGFSRSSVVFGVNVGPDGLLVSILQNVSFPDGVPFLALKLDSDVSMCRCERVGGGLLGQHGACGLS